MIGLTCFDSRKNMSLIPWKSVFWLMWLNTVIGAKEGDAGGIK